MSLRFSLRPKIILTVIGALLIPAAVILGVLLSLTSRYLRQTILQKEYSLVRQIATTLDTSQEFIVWQIELILREKKNFSEIKRELSNIFKQKNIVALQFFSPRLPKPIFLTRKDVPLKILTEKLSRDKQALITGERTFYRRDIRDVASGNYIVVYLEISDFRESFLGWRPEREKEAVFYILDKSGELILHSDRERQMAHPDFRQLPAVKEFLSAGYPDIERENIYRNWRGEKVIAFWYPLKFIDGAFFSEVPVPVVYQELNTGLKRLVLLVAVIFLVFIFLSWRVVEGLLKPIEKLCQATEQLSQQNYEIELSINTGDEIELLSQKFQQMAQDLKKFLEWRDNMIQMIVHDLKNPLSSIIAGLEYLKSSSDLSPEQEKLIGVALSSGQKLFRLIRNLLDVERLEEGKFPLKKEEFLLVDALKDTLFVYQLTATSEGKEFVWDIPENLKITSDRELLLRVIDNLYQNARQHTGSGGKIELKVMASDNDEKILFVLSDTGAGIPSEIIDRIFDRYVTGRGQRGTGLGLALVKLAVNALGGDIRVESKEKEGTKFYFTIRRHL